LNTEKGAQMKKIAGIITLTFVIGVVVGTSLSSGPNTASASSKGQRVCVDKRTGVMRLASVKKCSRNERSTVLGATDTTGRTVTIKYSSASGVSGDCGEGTEENYASFPKVYSGWGYDAANLTKQSNWSAVSNCSITLTVLDR